MSIQAQSKLKTSNIKLVDDEFMRSQWDIKPDYEMDKRLTPFGKATLRDRYLLPNETYQDRFIAYTKRGASNEAHAQRLYGYVSKHWFSGATPLISNLGAKRGLPISCFTKEVPDSMGGIIDTWSEGAWLGSKGGGVGSGWGNVRSIGEEIGETGLSSGVIPFICVTNQLTLAISQGSLRRASEAAYLPMCHPEIEEFIDIRRPQGGAPERRALNIHHGVMISDDFMKAVESDSLWELKSPKTNKTLKTVPARDLWIKVLLARLEQGEPYIIFSDTVDRLKPDAYKKLGLNVKLSNLCSEIVLATGKDHLNNDRTGVCCLLSMNLNYYDEYKDNQQFFDDVSEFIDNVLDIFIKEAPPEMKNAVYAAKRERSVGMGVMGFHSALQKKMIPFGSPASRLFNIRVFNNINSRLDKASEKLANERGAAPDNADVGINRRFVHKMAVAPTASISIIAGGASPGIDPITANVFTQKTLSGSFSVRNRELEDVLEKHGKNTKEVWSDITLSKGSVQHLDFLSDFEKDVFKTSFELNQAHIIDLAGDRATYIDQASSTNMFVRADTSKEELHNLHWRAWTRGVKSLYYCRSLSLGRADNVSKKLNVGNILEENTNLESPVSQVPERNSNFDTVTSYEVCESCQ